MRYRFSSGFMVAASAVMSLQRGMLRARMKGSAASDYALFPAPKWDFFFPQAMESSQMKPCKKKRYQGGLQRFNLRITFHCSFGEYARVYLLSTSEFDTDNQMSWAITQINFCDGPPPDGKWHTIVPEKDGVTALQ